MDAEDDALRAGSDPFLDEVDGEEAIDESNGEGTEESSSEEDLYDCAAISSGTSANTACSEGLPSRVRPGQIFARMGPIRLRSCRAGKVFCEPMNSTLCSSVFFVNIRLDERCFACADRNSPR